MATQEISDYVDGLSSATLVGTEELYLDTDEKCTVDELKTYITNGYAWKTIDIGAWDMDANGSLSVAHGLTFGFIRSVYAGIRNDAGTLYTDLISYGKVSYDATNIILERNAGELFDSVDYDSVAQSRGYITIHYID